ncbi:MAG: hypothetical protein IPG96_07315 [Proteobacteria bacterium]|nr:hypothetical protein [Pseudomonadota bacterium]
MPRPPASGFHGAAGFNSYDYDTNTWTRLLDFGYPPYTGKYDGWGPRRGLVDTRRRLFFSLGSGGATLVYDIAKAKVVSLDPEWEIAGGEAIGQPAAPGVDYDPAADALVGWVGGAAYVLPLGVSPKAWHRMAAPGPAVTVTQGTFGRWRYVSRYNVFLLVRSASENVTFYKHTAGCGP